MKDILLIAAGAIGYAALEWFTGVTAKVKVLAAMLRRVLGGSVPPPPKPPGGPPPGPPPSPPKP